MSILQDQAPATRYAIRALVVFAILICAGLTIGTMWTLQRPVLSAAESRLVGTWQRVAEKEGDPPRSYSFAADHSFRCDFGLTGRWSIQNGKLQVRYWADRKARWPLENKIRSFRTQPEEFDLIFEDDDRVSMESSAPPVKIIMTRASN